MPGTDKILVIRFSAMGDVAMTAPVLKELTESYPELQLIVVSRELYQPFFTGVPNVSFHALEPKNRHKGLLGLLRLFLELRAQHITAVADLHNNLRSKVLILLFFLVGVKSAVLDKGRKEKRQLTRKHGKVLRPLKLTVQRYADVFGQLGFPLSVTNKLQVQAGVPSQFIKDRSAQKTQKWIGVSPFAQHSQKVYPLHKMKNVVLALAKLGHRVFIFGGSLPEKLISDTWAESHENITSVVKSMSLDQELAFIAHLDVMLSMDSSGMHLASLKNIPVVSVWGSTHPYVGFLGYGQSISDTVQIDLYCRPCSVYGNVPCYRGDLACMNNLPEQFVVNKVLDKLSTDEATIVN